MAEQAHSGQARSDGVRERDRLAPGAKPQGRASAGPPDAPVDALQRAAGNTAVHEVIAGGGASLPAALRSDMERRFGADFSTVRVHEEPRAADLAERLSAKAVTVGPHIAFSRGRFLPDTREGKRLLGHELAHVVQQSRGGTARPTLDGGGPLEADAGRAADAVAAGDGAVEVAGESAVGVAAQPEEPKRPEVVGVDSNAPALDEDDIVHDGQGHDLFFDPDRGWLVWNGGQWDLSPTENSFVQGAAPAEKKSWLERYAEGVYKAGLAVPEMVEDAGAKVVDMTTQSTAVFGKATGLYDIGYTTWSSTSRQSEAGVSQSDLLIQAFNQAVPIVPMAKTAVAAVQGDPEALANLVTVALTERAPELMELDGAAALSAKNVAGQLEGGGAADVAAASEPTPPELAPEASPSEPAATPVASEPTPATAPAQVANEIESGARAADTSPSPETEAPPSDTDADAAEELPNSAGASPSSNAPGSSAGRGAPRIAKGIGLLAQKAVLRIKLAMAGVGESQALPTFASGGDALPAEVLGATSEAAATSELAPGPSLSEPAATPAVSEPSPSSPGAEQTPESAGAEAPGAEAATADAVAETPSMAPSSETATANGAPPTQASIDATRRAIRQEKGRAVWATTAQFGEKFEMGFGVKPGDRIRFENRAGTQTKRFEDRMRGAGYEKNEITRKWEAVSGQDKPNRAETARRRYNVEIGKIAEERRALQQEATSKFFSKETEPTTLDLENLDFGPGSHETGGTLGRLKPDVHLPLERPLSPTSKEDIPREGMSARHKHLPLRGDSGLTSEHGVPGKQWTHITTTPDGPTYDDNQYDYDQTQLVKQEVADFKTHEGRYSDNKRTEALKKKSARGERIDPIEDMYLPSLRQWFRAIDAAHAPKAAAPAAPLEGEAQASSAAEQNVATNPAASPSEPTSAADSPQSPAAPLALDPSAQPPSSQPVASPTPEPTAEPTPEPEPTAAAPAIEQPPPAPSEPTASEPPASTGPEPKPEGTALHGALHAANTAAALVRSYDAFETERERSGLAQATLMAGKTYLENTNVGAGAVKNYEEKLKDGQDKGEALISTLGETIGGFLVPGKGVDQAVNAAANLSSAVSDHSQRGDAGKGGAHPVADVVAGLTPSRMVSETLGGGARAAYNLVKSALGDARGVDKMGDDVTKGKLGPALQPLGMLADFAGNTGSGQGASTALGKTLEKAKDTPLAQVGTETGDLAYELGQSKSAKAGNYGAPVQGFAMLLGATSDHIAGKSWGDAIEAAAQPGKGGLADKIGSAGGDLAFAAHEKAVEFVDKGVPALKAEAQALKQRAAKYLPW